MNKKYIAVLIVIAFICSIGIVSADNNNTTENTTETIDLSQYITANQITNDKVEFSDGFIGFLIDSSKNEVSKDDGFTSNPTSNEELGNYLKLAIIECYKQNSEDKIGEVIESFADGSYKNSANPIIKEVLKSSEKIGDNEIVKINNDSEATFNFELLTPINDETSNYIAYTVSFKTIKNDDKLSASNEDNATQESNKSTAKNTEKTTNANNKSTDDKNSENTNSNNKSTEDKNSDKTISSKNNTGKTNPKENETETHVKNKTIVNKTNTLIVNEKNTTIINKTTVNHINNTTNKTPENNNILMQAAGNPITIPIIVIIIIAVVAFAYNRKD